MENTALRDLSRWRISSKGESDNKLHLIRTCAGVRFAAVGCFVSCPVRITQRRGNGHPLETRCEANAGRCSVVRVVLALSMGGNPHRWAEFQKGGHLGSRPSVLGEQWEFPGKKREI